MIRPFQVIRKYHRGAHSAKSKDRNSDFRMDCKLLPNQRKFQDGGRITSESVQMYQFVDENLVTNFDINPLVS